MSISNSVIPTRRIYEYHALAKEYLDKIHFSSIEDFKTAKFVLNNLLTNRELPRENSQLRNAIESLNDLLESPELYAQTKEEQDAFKTIVLKEIAKKVDELNTLSVKQQYHQIISQNVEKKRAKMNRDQMSRVKPPEKGSQAHAISEMAMLIEMQNRPEFVNDSTAAIDFDALAPELRDQLMSHGASVRLFANSQIALEDLIHLEHSVRSDLLEKPIDALNLIKAGLTLESFNELSSDIRAELLANSNKIIQLVNNGMTIDTFIRQYASFRQELLNNHIKVRLGLKQKTISFDEFVNLEKNLRSKIMPNFLNIAKLANKGVSLKDIPKLDESQLSTLLQNTKQITQMMQAPNAQLHDVLVAARRQ